MTFFLTEVILWRKRCGYDDQHPYKHWWQISRHQERFIQWKTFSCFCLYLAMQAVRLILVAILVIFLLTYISGRRNDVHTISVIRGPNRNTSKCPRGYRRVSSGKCRPVFIIPKVGAFYFEDTKFTVDMNTSYRWVDGNFVGSVSSSKCWLRSVK